MSADFEAVMEPEGWEPPATLTAQDILRLADHAGPGADILGPNRDAIEMNQHPSKWARAYARKYWHRGNEPETQAALNILGRDVDDLRESLARTADRLDAVLRRTPVRDADETLVEAESVLRRTKP